MTNDQPVDQPVSDVVAPIETETPVPVKTKTFSRTDLRSTCTVGVILPKLYPGYDPWLFNLRLKLSTEAEDRRQEFLSLAPIVQVEKANDNNLDELCDLLVSLPTGFEDLQDNGKGAGPSFKEYVNTSGPAKEILMQIVEGAVNLYWRTIMPIEFRPTV